MKVKDLFDIEYPKTLIFSQMDSSNDGINFVSAQEKNNGIVGQVKYYEGKKIYPAGVITVPLKGSVLMAHYQSHPCYVAHQIAVLTAKSEMSLHEKLFFCLCIRKNAYKFSYGRQADKTIGNLDVPDNIPEWVYDTDITPITTVQLNANITKLEIDKWGEYSLGKLFKFHKGKRLTKEDMTAGAVNFIGAISENNGVRQHIDVTPMFSPNCITVNYNGSVGEAFYQHEPFWASDDVNVLYADGWELNKHIAMFVITAIKANQYKFSYGRKWTLDKMKESIIKLPKSKNGLPDWAYMENYIKSLPYSDKI